MAGTMYGYVRVSTKEQCEDRQLIALQEYSISENKIYMDKLSGKDFNPVPPSAAQAAAGGCSGGEVYRPPGAGL